MNPSVIHGSQQQPFTLFHNTKLDKCNTRSGLYDFFIHINYDIVDYITFFFNIGIYLWQIVILRLEYITTKLHHSY